VHFMKLASASGFRPRPKLPRLFSEFTRARVTHTNLKLFRPSAQQEDRHYAKDRKACLSLSSDTRKLNRGFLASR
jgi:hypothetical protein